MNDRQPELKIGSYRLIDVTPPVDVPASLENTPTRAQLQLVLERDDGESDLSNFNREAFVSDLSRFMHLSIDEIKLLKVEAGSIRVLVELPFSAAQELYLLAGDTMQGLPSAQVKEGRDRTGQRIKDYELHEQIGVGGFGAVYRAYQPNVLRDVAIKIILPSYASQPEFVRRFEREARLVARLEHMNIVPLYDFWQDNDGAYLVMRWLRGGSLRARLKQGPLELEAVARILSQISAALAFAHQQGVIHRDIKPDNILLDDASNAYLSDFGIAKDLENVLTGTEHNVMHGTPHYMSPEPFRGEIITPASDVYSLGIVLYELLTGQRPYGSLPMAEIVYKKLHEPLPSITPLRADVPEAINGVIQKATAKDPTARYHDALSLVAALETAVQRTQGIGSAIFSSVIMPVTTTPVVGKLKATVYDRADLILEKPRRLIGRDDLITRIRGFLDENERVLLQGLGGIGKTSLAATLASGWIESGKGSVLWIEAANENADTLFESLARALGDQRAVVNKTGDERLIAVRRLLADKDVLLIIDNIWNERALYEMLKVVPPDMPMLMTSRRSVPIDGEIIDVGDLTPDEALELLNYHSRQNFVGNRHARELCGLLGYHPFTLEIAGKRLKVNRGMTPEQLIENIKDAPHELEMPDNFAEVGRQGVKDLLDASVKELSERSRSVFSSMGGLFSPAASLELFMFITDMSHEQLDPTLDDLQQRGLIELIPASEKTPDHFRLHDLTYSYVRTLYKDRFKNRQMVIGAIHAFVDDHAGALDMLEFEQPNILGGAQAAQGEDNSLVLIDIMTVLAVKGYMDARGHSLALLERLDDAIHVARQMQPVPAETLHYLLGKRGNAYRDRGELDDALKSYQEALELAPNPTRKAILTSIIGTVRFQQDATDAPSYFEQAEKIAKTNQDDFALSIILEHRGHHARALKDFEAARTFFQEALKVAERLQSPERIFFALLNIGAQEYDLGLMKEALANHQRAFHIADEHDNHLWRANAVQCIGEDYHGLGDQASAQKNLSLALHQFRSFGATARVAEIIAFMKEHDYPFESD
jgi:tetratricopeptide (TPR) repeat protein